VKLTEVFWQLEVCFCYPCKWR